LEDRKIGPRPKSAEKILRPQHLKRRAQWQIVTQGDNGFQQCGNSCQGGGEKGKSGATHETTSKEPVSASAINGIKKENHKKKKKPNNFKGRGNRYEMLIC